MGQELELKYRAPEQSVLDAVLGDGAVAGTPQTIAMHTQYLDTPDGALAARRWTLRLRRENDRVVACLKTPAPPRDGLPVRGEWECPATSVADAAALLVAAGAPAQLATLTAGGLTERCGAAFTRRAVALTLADGSQAELALDWGVLTGGGRRETLCEVELELLAGDPAAMVQLADTLAARYGLLPEPKSKFARARSLAETI